MREESNVILSEKLFKEHENYVVRKRRKNTLTEILKAILVSIYTSMWWTGLVLKNEFSLVAVIALTVLTVLVCVVAILCDEPVWVVKKENSCACEEKTKACL